MRSCMTHRNKTGRWRILAYLNSPRTGWSATLPHGCGIFANRLCRLLANVLSQAIFPNPNTHSAANTAWSSVFFVDCIVTGPDDARRLKADPNSYAPGYCWWSACQSNDCDWNSNGHRAGKRAVPNTRGQSTHISDNTARRHVGIWHSGGRSLLLPATGCCASLVPISLDGGPASSLLRSAGEAARTH